MENIVCLFVLKVCKWEAFIIRVLCGRSWKSGSWLFLCYQVRLLKYAKIWAFKFKISNRNICYMWHKKTNISQLVVCTRKLVIRWLQHFFYCMYAPTHRSKKVNKMETMSNISLLFVVCFFFPERVGQTWFYFSMIVGFWFKKRKKKKERKLGKHCYGQ